jgi:hypothetical protein
MATTTTPRIQVTQLYVSLFGRAPEAAGLNYWVGQLEAGKSVQTVAQDMYNVDAARVYYPNSATNAEIVGRFYTNVLGRTGDAEGLAYWTAKLNTPGYTKGSLVVDMINAVTSYAGADPAGVTSKALFTNKVDTGLYYGFTLGGNDVNTAAQILAGITADAATVAAAKAAFGIPLTNGTDILAGEAFTSGLVYTPGGDDRINSLQDEDQLTGTGTNNTLTATLGNANDNGGQIVTPKLTNIQNVSVGFTGSGSNGGNLAVVGLDLQDAGTTLKNIAITRVASTTDTNLARIENIKSVLETMSISNSNANQAGTIEFSFGTSTLIGDNKAALNLSDVQVGTINIGGNSSGTSAAGVSSTGYETLTINSAGSANSVGLLNLPMDTGTTGKITITGDKDLTIGSTTNVFNAAVSQTESKNYQGGIAQASGRLSAVDASAFTGNLTINLGNSIFTTGKADTSGAKQDVTITGGKGNDTFILADTLESGDSITGGDGTDTLLVVAGGNITAGTTGSSIITKVEAVQVLLNNAAATVDFDKLPDVTGVLVRNVSNTNVAAPANSAPTPGTDTFTLNNLTAGQAAAITIQHSNTGSNAITQNVVNANLKVSTGTSDTVALTIAEGLNTDPRFNVTLNTNTFPAPVLAANAVENITIVDADSESNTVALGSVASHSGVITIGTAAGAGKAGTFINFDTTTVGANGGLNRLDVSGATAGDGVGVVDLSLTAGQVKMVAGTVDASAELANVTVRVSTSAAVNGAQKITMGAGNDTVIFDNIQDTRAGLTISDTVAGGLGDDILVIDGDLTGGGFGTVVDLGASEWTNVSGFETVRTITPGAGNTYRLTLTDSLIAANNKAGVLAFVNDNDPANDAASIADTAGTAVEAAIVLDARALNNTSKFSYNGEEGASATADRIIMSDVNFNGSHVIDGGAVNNIPTDFSQKNADVIELRNATNGAIGDFANIRNIGTFELTNDLAITQVSQIQLNDTIVDLLVDSYQASNNTTHIERLTIRALDNVNVAAATVGTTLDAGALTDKSALDVALGRGLNTVTTGAGADRVVLLGNYVAGTYTTDAITGLNLNAQSTANAVARVVTDTINLGAGNDTLVTYGAINLAGATLSGIENITSFSALVITTSQYLALVAARAALSLTGPVITFSGNVPHQLTIVDDVAGVQNIDLSLIAVTSGTLTYDTTSSAKAGFTNDNTVTNTVTVSGGATATTGVIGTNPINGGGSALSPTAFTAGGVFTSTAGVNDNFTGTVANLSGTTLTGNAGDSDSITFSDAGTIALNNTTTGGTISNVKSVLLANGTNNVSFFNATSGITTVTGGTGNDAVDLTGAGTSFAAGNVNLNTGNNTLTLGGIAYTGTFSAGAGTADTLVLAAGANISGASLTGFENLTLAATGVYTMTAAEYNAFTGTVTAGNTETIAFTTAGTIVANSVIERFTLANGVNAFTASTNTVSVVGGTGADTFNYTATQIQAATTLDGGLGTDVLNIGAISNNLNISALVAGVETVNVTGSAAVGYTFTNENGAGVTLNYTKGAAGDVVVLGTGGQTVNLLGTAATAVTVTGGTGVDTINLSTTATGAETITTGSVIANIDTVANFKIAGADVFKTGTGATTLNSLTIATADSSTLAAAIATAATGAGAALAANTQAYIVTVSAGTAAGQYAFQNIGGTVGAVDATDFIVKITGAGSIVAGDFIA